MQSVDGGSDHTACYSYRMKNERSGQPFEVLLEGVEYDSEDTPCLRAAYITLEQ